MDKIEGKFNRLVQWRYFPLLLLLLVWLGLHLATITRPNNYIWDEIYYGSDAQSIIHGEGTLRLEHPPLAKLIITGGVKVFGDNPWGWRMPAVALSTIALIAFYDICRKLGTSHKTAFLATLLLSLENLMFIHSGMALLDIYVVVFTILAFWFYLKGQRWWWAAAVSVALAGLSKFSGILSIIPIVLHWFLIGRKLNMENPGKQHHSGTIAFIRSMALAPIAFFLLYGVFEMVIWAKWIPFVVWGHWDQGIVGNIKNALSFTNSIKFDYVKVLPSRPWEWLLSPTGSFYFYAWLLNPNKYQTTILIYYWGPSYIGMLSPTLWLSGLAVIPLTVWKSFKKNNAAIFVVCWLTGTWLMLVFLSLVTNRMSYSYYYLPSIGALALGTALMVTALFDKARVTAKSLRGQILEGATASFLLLHLLCFCVLSPLHLWLSIPVCALLLLFTLRYLGFGWRFIIQFYISAAIASLIVRLALYQALLHWLLSGIAVRGLTELLWVWTVGAIIGLTIAWTLFIFSHLALGRINKRKPTNKKRPIRKR